MTAQPLHSTCRGARPASSPDPVWSVTACLDPTGVRLWLGPALVAARTAANAQARANRALEAELARLRGGRRPRWSLSRWRWAQRKESGQVTALAWLLVDGGGGKRPVAVVKIRLAPTPTGAAQSSRGAR